MADKIHARFWGRQIDDVMSEIARQAAICQVKLLDPGVIDAVIQNNDSICGNNNPRSFKKLRELLMLGFVVRENSVDKLGAVETQEMIEAVRERIRQHQSGGLKGPGG